MKLANLHFTRLIQDKDLTSFDCGDNDLNDFIHHDAWVYQQELLSVTYLFEDMDSNVVAFFSVLNDSLKDQGYEKWNYLSRKVSNQKRRKEYPAVKIGRLGVSTIYYGKSLGTQIISFIKHWFSYNNKTGCRFLLVDAYNNPRVIKFYMKNEFTFLTEKDTNKKTRLMYFDLIRMIPE